MTRVRGATAVRIWWRRRTLHARVSLLVSGAVGISVLIVAAVAFAAVAEIQEQQTRTELMANARVIAAAPEQWLSSSAALPGDDRGGHDGRRPHDLGTRWQILDAAADVVGDSAARLPITVGARRVAAGGEQRVQESFVLDGDRYLMLTVPATGGGAVQVAINEDPARNTLATFGAFLAVGSAIGIGLAALLGRAVSRAGLAPVGRLTEAVEEAAVTMDLTRPVAVTGVDEIARLGRVVNTLMAAIETSRRAQRTLVEDAGHELRTPLTSLRTNIELLIEVDNRPELAHRLPAEDRAKLLRDLDAQVAELSTLTGELVDLAREDAAREPVGPVDLGEVVAAAINRVRMRAPGLDFSAELNRITVSGRAAELERMVLNVLDNAAKWSPASGTVRTTLTSAGPDRCVITVADTGPGIAESDRPHVFDRFYRAPSARAMTGSGLGLAIVAQTAAQHGGTVTVGPHRPHGTLVTIRLPRTPS